VNRRRTPVRRQIAVATWRPSRDGRIYARMEVDVTAALTYLEHVRAESGTRVTLTHVVGAALGRALRDVPEIRARVVFGRLVPLEACDIGFAVDIGNGSDLAPVKVADADRLSPVEVARAVEAGAAGLRRGSDSAYRRTSRIVQRVAASSLVSGGLGRTLAGQPGFPLGTAFVSNVGTLGLDEAFLAPLPFARTPVYLAVGAVHDRAVVVDGEVVPRPVLVLVATADHRVVDGVHAGRMASVVRELLSHPERLDGTSAQTPGRTGGG
jgi:pyruvate/2-oxoglutarate dehydrogenase complex dihydrolipoamide acyltransferase (E2) component